ncbi:hypothetical protein NDU88_001007, partial [Pleurodeles waltl]
AELRRGRGWRGGRESSRRPFLPRSDPPGRTCELHFALGASVRHNTAMAVHDLKVLGFL